MGEKTFLVPFGEYLPYAFEIPLKIFGGENWIQNYKNDRYILRGKEAFFDRVPETTVVCSAVFSPSLWSEAIKKNGEVLVFPASQWMFEGNFPGQAEASLRFIAASNDRWLVKASNGGKSYVFDNTGRIIAENRKLNGQEIIQVEVKYKKTIPLSVRFENWPVLASTLILVAAFIKRKK